MGTGDDLNRPFIFVIQDQENNIPLFIGKIASPNEALGEEEVANAESLVSNRSNLPIQSPEDIAYLRNNPEASLHLDERECLEQVEDYVNSNKVMFPCPPYDTQPIEEHKQSSETDRDSESMASRLPWHTFDALKMETYFQIL